MKRLLMAVLVIGGLAWGKDARAFSTHALPECSEFLDAYSRTTLLEGGGFDGPHEAWEVFGWVTGYITAYNRLAGDGNILGAMAINDSHRWIASWCRDNPSKDVDDALQALFSTLQ